MSGETLLQPKIKAACPSCGAEVFFKSSISVFAVCKYCKSMIVRHDMDLEAIGQMAQLPEDVSPLKIGSRGRYNKTRFEVAGRLKVAWSEGYWNEWFLLFENGRHGWLAEAMGFFMLSFEVNEVDKVPERNKLKVGTKVDLPGMRTFFVDDIREAVCIGSEGELPFKGMKGRKAISADLSDASGEFACIEYSGQDGVRLFTGRYLEFEALEMSNLRDLSADIKKIRDARLFNCPSCGGSISMMTPGLTAAVVCKYCGATIDVTNENMKVLSKAAKKMRITPLIPIGSKGRFYGKDWEIIGFMQRSDPSGNYPWEEYLLFNPQGGFRWLTQYNGHWNFVRMTRLRPATEASASEVRFGNRGYKRYLEGKARVAYVLGEFYWRVKVGDTVDVSDYISPPEILSCESDISEAVWSVGRYIEPEEVMKAFELKEGFPAKRGVGVNQPSPYAQGASRTIKNFFLIAAALTIMQIYFVNTAQNREVYRGEFNFNTNDAAASIATPSFDVPGGLANLAVDLYSPVQNDWMEASIDLIDDKTQQSIEFDQGVEFYSGSDSDGPWREGNQSSNLVISSVPGGSYHLLIQPVSAQGTTVNKGFTISLHRDVSIWGNYWTALFFISIYPLIILWKRRAFEVKRWSESDFSPYVSDTEGDD